tara:strand:- start:30180 stop:31400 length:1221 start_codon:yes stop_codon:yes gene_type:complete
MKASIITIGNELLKGFTIDSNSSYIGSKLTDLGVRTVWKATPEDNSDEIIESIKIANSKSDIIICTGGLGPTIDDVTLKTFSSFINKKILIDEEYLKVLKNKYLKRNIKMSDINKNQSNYIEDTNIIPNDLGSARGIDYFFNNAQFFFLPGVPKEMRKMFDNYVVNKISNSIDEKYYTLRIKTFGIVESKIQELIYSKLDLKNISISFLPSFKGVQIILFSKSLKLLNSLGSEIECLLGDKVYTNENFSLEEIILKLLANKKLTFSIAESCSGGLTSDLITNIPGSSKIFKGSIISYSNESKISLLNVSKESIKTFGAVSDQVAKEMAIGVRKRFNTDIGLSITGIAGPTGDSKDKPIGFTSFGINDSNGDFVLNRILSNHRRTNKELSSRTILNLLRLKILERLN